MKGLIALPNMSDSTAVLALARMAVLTERGHCNHYSAKCGR